MEILFHIKITKIFKKYLFTYNLHNDINPVWKKKLEELQIWVYILCKWVYNTSWKVHELFLLYSHILQTSMSDLKKRNDHKITKSFKYSRFENTSNINPLYHVHAPEFLEICLQCRSSKGVTCLNCRSSKGGISVL